MHYTPHVAMTSKEVGEELVYPSVAAALLAAALVLLLSDTVGQYLMDRNAVERFIREWLPIFPPFMQALPRWAREAPLIFGGIAVAVILTVRSLAAVLPGIAVLLLAVAVVCAVALVAPPTRMPAGAEDWIFVCYVILTAFVAGAPKPYEDQI